MLRWWIGKADDNIAAAIQANDPQMYRAYRLKTYLHLLLKSTDIERAEAELKHWLFWASKSRIPAFIDLCHKIKHHKEHILNTNRYGFSNVRIERTNNKMKLIMRKAYVFRNINNMIDMVYHACSDIQVPLPDRNQNSLNLHNNRRFTAFSPTTVPEEPFFTVLPDMFIL